MGKHAVWGLDTTIQPNPLIIGRADAPADITNLKQEWRNVYPNMKFQLSLNYKEGDQPKPDKWQ